LGQLNAATGVGRVQPRAGEPHSPILSGTRRPRGEQLLDVVARKTAQVLDAHAQITTHALANHGDGTRSGFERVDHERGERLGESPSVAVRAASGLPADRNPIAREAPKAFLDPLVERKSLGVLGSREQEFPPFLEEIECPGELRLRRLQRLGRILPARVTPAGAFEMQRYRRKRGREVVKERAQKLPSGRGCAIVRIVHQLGILCATNSGTDGFIVCQTPHAPKMPGSTSAARSRRSGPRSRPA
jgi:hypothetical protein